MKRQIRKSVFETNSSSVHTLVYPKGNCNIPISDIAKDGVVTVQCSDFSYCGYVEDLYEKLQYLCSYIALDNPYKKNFDSSEGEYITNKDDIYLDNILYAIKMKDPSIKELRAIHCECAMFDHQTSPDESSCIVNLNKPDDINTFLFNDEIKIKLDRD